MARINARKTDSGRPAAEPHRKLPASGAPTASGLPYGTTLPAQSAFVVHFAGAGGPSRRRFIGRVEHLSSAEVAAFSSLRGLLAFFERLALARR